jgi:hypothetical protein
MESYIARNLLTICISIYARLRVAPAALGLFLFNKPIRGFPSMLRVAYLTIAYCIIKVASAHWPVEQACSTGVLTSRPGGTVLRNAMLWLDGVRLFADMTCFTIFTELIFRIAPWVARQRKEVLSFAS